MSSIAGIDSVGVAPVVTSLVGGGEPRAVDRFEISLAVEGAFMPGKPIRVVGSVRSLQPTAQAELAIILPEVEAARRGNWRVMRAPIGERIAETRRTISLPVAATQTAEATVVIPVAGYYRALIRVQQLSSEPHLVGGVFILPMAIKEIWFYVDPHGGRITKGFDPTVFPDSLVPLPGPARVRGKRSVTGVPPVPPNHVSSNRPASSMNMMAAKTSSVATDWDGMRHLVYYNADSGSMQPARWVTLHFQTCEVQTGTCYGIQSDMTDDNGEHAPECPPSWDYTTTGTYELSGAGFEPIVVGGFSEDPQSCFSDYGDQSLPDELLGVFYHFQEVVSSSRAFISEYSRGNFNLRVGDFGGISSYTASTDFISIQDVGPNRAVWTEYGLFTAAHEYGHALHQAALGGIPPYSCSAHSLGDHINIGCAFGEGFADYHAVAILAPGRIPSYQYAIETNPYSYGLNGEDDEAEVAATMFDLTDPVNESHDLVELNHSYVARVIAQCRLSSSPTIPNGIDDFIYCAEGGIDPDASSLLSMRSPRPIQSLPSQPPGWSKNAVRVNWRKNLFDLQ